MSSVRKITSLINAPSPIIVPPPPPIEPPRDEIINHPIDSTSGLLNIDGYHIGPPGPPTTDSEILSLILYLNPIYFPLYDPSQFTQLKDHIYYFINNTRFDIGSRYVVKDFILPIFNIYDDGNILNPDYGSDSDLFYEASNKLTNTFNSNSPTSSSPLVFNSEYPHIIDNLIGLLYFLKPTCTNDCFILNLGSLYHATCLLFKKLPEGLIKVVHINTGLGINVKTVYHDLTTYHRIFEKTIYLTPEMIPAFIKFLKPFLFFRKAHLADVNLPIKYVMIVMSDYIDRVLNYEIDFDRKYMKPFYNVNYNNIYDYYLNMYESIKMSSEFTYKYLNDIFSFNSFRMRFKKTGMDYTQNQYDAIFRDINHFNNKSKLFYDYFMEFKESRLEDFNDNIPLQNYLRKSLDNFKIHFDKTIYFTAQSAGTCMYKSLLMSMIYNFIYYNDKYNDDLIFNVYLEFSMECFANLNNTLTVQSSYNLEKAYIEQTSNTSKIINQLVIDEIISSEFKLVEFVKNKKLKYIPLNYQVDNSVLINTEDIRISVIHLDILNEILDNIRNNNNRADNLNRINDLILQFIKNSELKDIHRTYCEVLLLCIVWELYYHKDIWEERINQYNFHYSNIIFLDLLAFGKFRLDFNYNEVEWISKFYIYITFNSILIEETEILKNIILLSQRRSDELRIILPNSIVNYNINGIINEKITENNIDQIYASRLSIEPINQPTSHTLPPPPPPPQSFLTSAVPPPLPPPPIISGSAGALFGPIVSGTTVGTQPPLRPMITIPVEMIVPPPVAPRPRPVPLTMDAAPADTPVLPPPPPPIRMYETSTISRIYKYFNYLYFKSDIIQQNYSFTHYMFDNDIFNFNRFMINHFKHNDNFHIELSESFKNIKSNENYKRIYTISNIINQKEGTLINNIYIMQSFIDAFSIYCVYLTDAEKYKILKQIFISCKPIIENYVDIINNKLISQVVELINTILPDVFISILSNTIFMSFKLDKYLNKYSTNLYDNNSADVKVKYDFSHPNSIYFLYKQLLELFENDNPINKDAIDKIVLLQLNTIDSPYFNVDKKNPLLKNLIIGDTVITDKFNKINQLERTERFNGVNVNRYFLLGKILSCNNKINSYINERKTHLVYVLERHHYHSNYNVSAYMPDNVVIAFEIKPGPNNQIILKDNGFINSNPILFSYNNMVDDYPFMAFASDEAINFIEKKHNNYILHCISNNINDEHHELHRIVKERFDNYYVSFQIKQNYLTPFIDTNKHNYLTVFYSMLNPIKSYVRNMVAPNITQFDFKLQNIVGLDVLSDFKDSGRVEELFNSTKRNINKIINSILLTENVPYVNLVEWINNNTDNSLTLYNEKLKCDLDCKKISADPFKEKIKNIKHLLIRIRKFLIKKLNHDYARYLEFLYKNYFTCYFIMQANIYINSLNRLLSAINNCEPILCHELIEMNNIFNKKVDYKYPIICGIVEILFGNIIKNEQWDKINSIYQNYLNRENNKWQVHQFMMGKGKSSIITPMIISMLHFKYERSIYLVVPEHLKKQTINTMVEYQIFLGINTNVYSDNDIKLEFLNGTLRISNSILIIDEFDFMYSPLQSNFNKIELSEKLEDDKIERVFTIVNDMLIKGIKYKSRPYKVVSEIKNILSDSNNIKNVSYGMSEKENYRYCIPYMRKDSPNEGSKFSSILLTMVLTILYFYNPILKKYILEIKDISLAFDNKKLFRKLLKVYNINQTQIEDVLYDFRKISIDNMPVIPENIMREYMVHIFSQLKKSLIIKNCSFIDLINMDSRWQVGYSGTVNINMNFPLIQNWIKYNPVIIEDPDEKKNVQIALTNDSTIHRINKYNVADVFDLVINNKYNVLIDACALLKDYDNKQVAEILYNKLPKGKKKTIIYLLKDDTKMIYNGEHILYEEKMYKTNEIIYYYSQRHIVGIDFKQPNILNGLILINNSNIYTDVSQAIYRMRKLNKGHTAKICYVIEDETSNITTSQQVYDLITNNEINMNNQNKPMLLYQYIKFFIRKYYTKHYFEVDLNIFSNQPTVDIIYRKLAHNLFSLEYTSPNQLVNQALRNYRIRGAYSTVTFRSSNTLIDGLMDELMAFDLDTLLKLVFNTNSIQKEVSSEIQTESEVAIEQLRTTLAIPDFNELYRRITIKYNPLRGIEIFLNNFTYKTINLGDKLLSFSRNLIKNLPGANTAIIIRLNNNTYLLDHLSVFSHYVYMCPIYTLSGNLINHFVFTSLPKSIDFSTIFNYKLLSMNNLGAVVDEINIGYIIFGITEDLAPINTVISEEDAHDIKVLIALSDVNIFRTNDPELVNLIRNINLTIEYANKHKIFNFIDDRVRIYTSSLLDFYQNMPNNKTTDNNIYRPEVQGGPSSSVVTHELGFTLNSNREQRELEVLQVAT